MTVHAKRVAIASPMRKADGWGGVRVPQNARFAVFTSLFMTETQIAER